MRAIFSVLSLLVVVAVIALLAKKQLSPVSVQLAPADGAMTLPAASQTPQQQSQQIQQQVRESLEKSLQQARPMPEDK